MNSCDIKKKNEYMMQIGTQAKGKAKGKAKVLSYECFTVSGNLNSDLSSNFKRDDFENTLQNLLRTTFVQSLNVKSINLDQSDIDPIVSNFISHLNHTTVQTLSTASFSELNEFVTQSSDQLTSAIQATLSPSSTGDPTITFTVIVTFTIGGIEVTITITITISFAEANGDPHFVGFHGERYDVMGEELKWFNILTDNDTQVNAFFEAICTLGKGTMMGEIAIRFENNTFHFNASDALVNGNTLNPGSAIQIKHGLYVVRKSDHYFYIQTSGYSFEIKRWTHGDQSKIESSSGLCTYANFDISISAQDFSRFPHGIVGQTAHHNAGNNKKAISIVDIGKVQYLQGEGVIEGNYTDYIVQDGAFGVDFVYNKFNFVLNAVN